MSKNILRKSILFATTSGFALAIVALPFEFDPEKMKPVLKVAYSQEAGDDGGEEGDGDGGGGG